MYETIIQPNQTETPKPETSTVRKRESQERKRKYTLPLLLIPSGRMLVVELGRVWPSGLFWLSLWLVGEATGPGGRHKHLGTDNQLERGLSGETG